MAFRSRSQRARSSPCSARTAPARRPRCAPSPARCDGRAARSASPASVSAAAESVAKAGIAHVPEGRGTFTELSVLENLRLGAYTRRDREVSRRGAAGGLVSVACRAPDQQAGTLSRRRAADACARPRPDGRPRLVMMDEPSLGLAPMIVREIFRIVRELNAQEGSPSSSSSRTPASRWSPPARLRPGGRSRRDRRVERDAARGRGSAPELPGY